MTESEEKAQELIEKYKTIIGHSDLHVLPAMNLDLNKETEDLARQCALVYVQDAIAELEDANEGVLFPSSYIEQKIEKWLGVKAHLTARPNK